jgi:hypothetical protein
VLPEVGDAATQTIVARACGKRERAVGSATSLLQGQALDAPFRNWIIGSFAKFGNEPQVALCIEIKFANRSRPTERRSIQTAVGPEGL